ncbi:hypothetical protein LCGC14_2364290 [marine sediment metagenome]|uniref:Holin of 3TMs, for gene-transfer release n=1 Tax=marine sediment metagenome TaxID=412755 RepID=A0A0F9C5K5_9ZZZZ
MSWMTSLFSMGIGKIVKDVSGAFDLTGEKKHAFELSLEQSLQKRDSELEETFRAELVAKERVLVAELQQGDNYTKRARPTVVYAGLVFIGINYVLVPIMARFFNLPTDPIPLPPEFWYGWSGIVGTWSIGRSLERRGARNRVLGAITGTPKPQTSRLMEPA